MSMGNILAGGEMSYQKFVYNMMFYHPSEVKTSQKPTGLLPSATKTSRKKREKKGKKDILNEQGLPEIIKLTESIE